MNPVSRSPSGRRSAGTATFPVFGRDNDRQQGFAKSLMVFLNGEVLHDTDREGKPLREAAFLLLFNAHHEPLDFTLPPASFGDSWRIVIDTATEVGEREGRFTAGSALAVEGRSVIVLSPL